MKRGIVELADLVVVNKADGDLADRGRATPPPTTRAALHLVRPRVAGVDPPGCSRARRCRARHRARSGTRSTSSATAVADDLPAPARRARAGEWMWSEVTDTLLDALTADPATAALARRLEAEVAAGTITPTAAARAVVEASSAPAPPDRPAERLGRPLKVGTAEDRQKGRESQRASSRAACSWRSSCWRSSRRGSWAGGPPAPSTR